MIEVFCVCGKRYAVPPDKAGKKLQCRRCGNVQRVPGGKKRPAKPAGKADDAVVVPFAVPDEDDDGSGMIAGDDAPLLAPEAPPLDLRDSVHRCPSCGLQDDASVVVCVRCGYDWRAGRRMVDAHESAQASARLRLIAETADEVARIDKLAWAALSPLGLVLGPWLLLRTVALGRHLAGLDPKGAGAATVVRVRVLSLVGLVAWLGVVGFFVLSRRPPGDDPDAAPVQCRLRLEALGTAIRAQLAPQGRFPPETSTWPQALEGLSTAPASPVGADGLRCPMSQSLYPYSRRESELLTPEVAGDYLLLWDRDPHPDERARLVLRALRFDGTVELFSSRADLEGATRRPPFRGAAAVTPPPPTKNGAGQGTALPPVRPETPQGRRVEAFLRFAEEVDDSDPDFSKEVSVDLERFTVKVGLPPLELLPTLLRGQEEEVRRQAARILARLALPPDKALALARELVKDADPEVRFGAAMALRRHKDATWLALTAGVVDEARTDATRKAAMAWLGREATASPQRTKAVLEVFAARRKASDAQGAGAMVQLPVETLPAVALLVADKGVGREARASLFSAGEAGAEAAIGLLSRPDPQLKRAAFQVLDDLRASKVIPLDAYLRHVANEVDTDVRAGAMARLAEGLGPPDTQLLTWALDQARLGVSGKLKALCDAVLARCGGAGQGSDETLELLVNDLATTGGNHAAVLASLRLPARLLDERVDNLAGRALGRIRDPATRVELVKVLYQRPTEASLRVAVAAIDDADEEVRVEALRSLLEANAVRGDDLRREAARALAQRLRPGAETSPRAQEMLYALCSGGLYCAAGGGDEGEHRCSPALMRGLEGLARKGDRAAIRCLGTHPNEGTIKFLISLYDAKEPPSPEVGMSLARLSGMAIVTIDGAEWRKQLQPLPPRAVQTLAAASAADVRDTRAKLDAGQKRLADLKAGAGR